MSLPKIVSRPALATLPTAVFRSRIVRPKYFETCFANPQFRANDVLPQLKIRTFDWGRETKLNLWCPIYLERNLWIDASNIAADEALDLVK
jgi:hypothetical protein